MQLLPSRGLVHDIKNIALVFEQMGLIALLPSLGLEISGRGRKTRRVLVPFFHAVIDDQAVFLFQFALDLRQRKKVPVRRVNAARDWMHFVDGQMHMEVIGVDVGARHPLMLAESESLGEGPLDVLEIIVREFFPITWMERHH